MKFLLFCLLFGFASQIHAQKLITAEKKDSLNHFEWGNRPEPKDDSPNLWINNICSFPMDFLKASSTLSSQGTKNYGTKNLSDDDPRTAWVEGKKDEGLNEYLEIKTTENSMFTNTLVIYNGYQSTITNFKNNSRVKKLGISLDGKTEYQIQLLDIMGGQTIAFPDSINEALNDGNKHSLKLIILEVYPGAKWKDTAISEIYFQGC